MKIYNKIITDIETGQQIEAESFEYVGKVASCGPAAAIGGGGGLLGTIGTGLSMASAANDLFGPKGAMVTGDISKGAKAAQGLYSGSQDIFGTNAPTPEKFGPPTTQTTMGLTADEFSRIPPEVRQELLRKLAGR